MNKYAGYINLKNLNGVLYPSSIQNIMMKEYISKNIEWNFLSFSNRNFTGSVSNNTENFNW